MRFQFLADQMLIINRCRAIRPAFVLFACVTIESTVLRTNKNMSKTNKGLRSTLASVLFIMAAIFMPFNNIMSQDAAPPPAAAEETSPKAGYDAFIGEGDATSSFIINNTWILICAFLVFLMHLGFATLETGLTQAKNCTNILFKNVFIISMGILAYALWGFNAMYPGTMGEDWNGYFAIGSWFGIDTGDAAAFTSNFTAEYNVGYTWWTDFIFQAMFAATAATIVSGSVAERVKLPSFMIFATLLVAFAYPVSGGWKWGTGWLDAMGFYDFAGSSIVHAFGGFAALACVLVLGPRKGKYANGQIKPILGHSMPLATIGVFLLFLGWFGFNGGSVLSADPYNVSFVFCTTALAAVTGALVSMLVSWAWLKKPDLSMALNGILAGLVGITAGADSVGMFDAIIIGAVAGALVVFSIVFFDRIKIDDPVGAISVHGICGIWGTLAVGIFNAELSIGTQLVGTLAISAWAFVFSFIVFSIIKVAMGVRVSEEDETTGLDVAEHGQPAYSTEAAPSLQSSSPLIS
jgi:Amt family ammonium transporter